MKRFVSLLFTVALLCPQVVGQKPSKFSKDHNGFADNECFAKGGIGIINERLYIVVKSERNELVFGDKKGWIGKESPTQEVVIFFADSVWSPQAVPEGFDLSKAIVVSFERSKVRFFDFTKMSGGYYKRHGQE